MYLRRAVSKTLALPLRAPPGPAPLRKDASLRWISSNKFPGLPGSNMLYYVLVGVTVSAGGYCTFRAVSSDQAKHPEQVTSLKEKAKAELPQLQGEEEKVEAGEVHAEAPEETAVRAEATQTEQSPEAAGAVTEEAGLGTWVAAPGGHAEEPRADPEPEAPHAVQEEVLELSPGSTCEGQDAVPDKVTATGGETGTTESTGPQEHAVLDQEKVEPGEAGPSTAVEAMPEEAGLDSEAASAQG